MTSIDPVEVLVWIGTCVYQAALNQGLSLDRKILQPLYERVINYRGGPEDDEKKSEATVAAKLNLVLTEFTVQLSHALGKRGPLLEDLLNDCDALLQHINSLLESVKKLLAEQDLTLIVVVDGLDKISPPKAKNMFLDQPILPQIACKVIYTFPITLMYGENYSDICEKFDNNEISMPNLKITTRDGRPCDNERHLLQQMIFNRMERDLIAQDALERLVELSGRLPRELIFLARDACVNALVDECPQIEQTHVHRYEGAAAAAYFWAWRMGLPPEWNFQGRAFYPPPDAVNAMLSFGYTLLLHDVLTAVHQVGLDPYMGTFHVMESGRPSLALDVMEEFRPLVIDRLVLAVIAKKMISLTHFERPLQKPEALYLDKQGRAVMVDAYEQMMQTKMMLLTGEQTMLRRVVLLQVMAMARVFRGEETRYVHGYQL